MIDKILIYIIPVLTLPMAFIVTALVTLISILLYPFFRITVGETITFEIPIRISGLKMGYFFRKPIESILGNKLLFFSEYPYKLFVNKKDIEQLPKDIYDDKNVMYSMKQKRTIVATFETKKLKFTEGYLPAKLIYYKIIDKEPEFSKS